MVDQSNAMLLRMAILAFGGTGPTRSTDKSYSVVDLRALDGCIAEVDPQILGDRGESAKPLRWRYRGLLIEWGFKKGTENLAFDGNIQSTHFLGKVGTVKPLRGDSATEMTAEHSWKSSPSAGSRRGIVVSVLYADTVRGTGRTILTVRTCSGSFSFQPVDLEDGPILAPAHGFFVADISSNLTAAGIPRRFGIKEPEVNSPDGSRTRGTDVGRRDESHSWKNRVFRSPHTAIPSTHGCSSA